MKVRHKRWTALLLGAGLVGGGSVAAGSSPPASGEFGLIDGIYQGAAGFTLDPADCPDDWDPMQGITDEEIHFLTSLPKAGSFAAFGMMADGIQSYFDYVNAQGGIDGRNLVLEVRDDGYEPDQTKSNVDAALEAGDVAGLIAVLGTANNLAVWDDTNDECMPQLFNSSGAPEWGDAENHPWTTGMQLDFATEANLWAQWLVAEHPEATTVAAVAFNNDFGHIYAESFERATEGTDLTIEEQLFHEPAAPNLTNEFTTLAATEADVVLVETTGTFCTQAMAEIEKNPDWDPIVILSASCSLLSQFFQPLIDQGLTGEGAHLIQYIKDVNDPAWADDEFVQLFHETLTEQGLDPTQSTYANGWLSGWFLEQILRDAATYAGGLDRGNIMLAARNQDVQHPLLLDGVRQQILGLDDAYLVEGGQMAEYVVTNPDELGSWQSSGELLELNGTTGIFSDIDG